MHIIRLWSCLVFFILSPVQAEQYTVDQAAQQCVELNLQIPKPEKDGWIKTLNEKGSMSAGFDKATQKFIDFSKNKKVLEIGGAYGTVMREVLKRYPRTIYHFNDLDARHLFIAAYLLKSDQLDEKALNNIRLMCFDVTVPLKACETYDAILAARVLHFFSPTQTKMALENFFSLLNPGGRIYVIATTPYARRYKSFIGEYERRLLEGTDDYPGYVKSLSDWINKSGMSPSQLSSISRGPFMFLDDKILRKSFEKAGFKIVQCEMIPLASKSFAWSLDGRENVLLIAEKPIRSKL